MEAHLRDFSSPLDACELHGRSPLGLLVPLIPTSIRVKHDLACIFSTARCTEMMGAPLNRKLSTSPDGKFREGRNSAPSMSWVNPDSGEKEPPEPPDPPDPPRWPHRRCISPSPPPSSILASRRF
ncbi:unnamed protein product [Arabis nemorensis]|uniref:Uncharacterized protein n=1 Tax=Arabis nemorensis TaxID=586526 RepID=A0A565C4A9_9BRAS|nr:unnamed protein product [Arabis nemorensis]